MSIEDLDDQIGEKSSKNKYLTWVIIGIIIIAAIAVPMILLRQSEPAEATEPTTIEEIRTEVQTLWDTVYGTDGLETKIALHAESIADFVSGDCTCPDYSGQFQNINNDLILLRTDLNAIPDYAGNITQVNTDLTKLSADLTVVETSLLALQDWGPDITSLNTGLANANTGITGLGEQFVGLDNDLSDLQTSNGDLRADLTAVETSLITLNSAISIMQEQITSLQSDIASLPTSLPRYAYVTNLGEEVLEIGVIGSGDYPVVVTIYGTGLTLGKVGKVYPVSYNIDEMVYASGKILTIFVEPITPWGASDTITLVIIELTGSISYVSASVGA